MKVKIMCLYCGIEIIEDTKKFKNHKFKNKGETFIEESGHSPTHTTTYSFKKDVIFRSIKCPGCDKMTPLLQITNQDEKIEDVLDEIYLEILNYK